MLVCRHNLRKYEEQQQTNEKQKQINEELKQANNTQQLSCENASTQQKEHITALQTSNMKLAKGPGGSAWLGQHAHY
jgi:hypothetical protein